MTPVETESSVLPKAELAVVKPRPQWRTRYNRLMKLVRRAHLYAGLFMTPWVFLYGVTAFLFNHPEAFPDARTVHFAASKESDKASIMKPLPPSAIAQRVVDAVNASPAAAKDGTTYRLVRPAEARYARDFFASVRGQGQEHIVRIDLRKGEGSVRTQTKSSKKPAPFVRKGGIKLSPPPLEPVTAALPRLLDTLGISGDQTIDRTISPDVSFLMEGGGQVWRVTYAPQSGQLSGQPEAEASPLSTRSYLLRLHLAHEYPSEKNARWYWALAVDAMFVSMVGWGITGLLMWWQMKNVRKIGIAVLIASAVAATAVAIGMHRLLTA